MDNVERLSEAGAMEANLVPEKRDSLLASFAKLVLSRRYQEIGVASIVAEARTARSTFYYHFKSKNELLQENLAPFFGAIANAAFESKPSIQLKWWIEHIWENRLRARQLFDGRTGAMIQDNLVRELQNRLHSLRDGVDPIRANLDSIAIGGGIFAILRGWLASRISSSAEDLALELHRFMRSALTDRTPTHPA